MHHIATVRSNAMLRGWDRTFYSLTSIIISPSSPGTGRIDPCNNHLYKISIRAVRVSIQGRELYKCQANEAFMIITTTCGALQSEGGEWHIPGLSLTPGLAIWDMIHYLETSYSHICLYLGYNNCFTDTNTSRKFVWFFCGYLEGIEESYSCWLHISVQFFNLSSTEAIGKTLNIYCLTLNWISHISYISYLFPVTTLNRRKSLLVW